MAALSCRLWEDRRFGFYNNILYNSINIEGKETISRDFVEFSKAASSAYKLLSTTEKEALKLRSSEQIVKLSAAAKKREGTKLLNEIQKLVSIYVCKSPSSKVPT